MQLSMLEKEEYVSQRLLGTEFVAFFNSNTYFSLIPLILLTIAS